MFSNNFKNTIITGITAWLLTTWAGISEWANEKAEDAKNSVKVEAVQDKIKAQVDSTLVDSALERQKLMAELWELDDNKDWTIDSTEQLDIDTRGLLDELIADVQKENFWLQEQQLLTEYKKALWSWLEELAEQMVIGRRDYFENIKGSSKYEKLPKSIVDKIAISWWDKFYNNFIKWEGYTWYDTIPEDTPILARYIAENINSLLWKNKIVDAPIRVIKSAYFAKNDKESADFLEMVSGKNN